MGVVKNIRHIFFDFDDTLWDFEANSNTVLRQLFEEFDLSIKLQVSVEDFLDTYKKINLSLWSRLYKREIDKQFLRDHRFAEVFRQFDYENFEENLTISQQYLSRAPHGSALKPGCIEMLEDLRDRYELHIITNGFMETQHLKMKACGLAPYFKHFIISEEHGFVKPELGIFRKAEQLSGAGAENCLMVGDSYESDIVGAITAGWEAIHFCSKDTMQHHRRVHHLSEIRNLV